MPCHQIEVGIDKREISSWKFNGKETISRKISRLVRLCSGVMLRESCCTSLTWSGYLVFDEL